MRPELSDRQKKILDYIKNCVRMKGYPPSVREIGKAVGLSSSSTVHSHLEILEKAGYIKKDPTLPRAIEIIEDDYLFPKKEIISVPLLGRITAGLPVLAVENMEDSFPVPLDFLGSQGDFFMLSVDGESMIEAGILDGDYVIIRQQSSANNGDIVAALLDDEATVKRFYKEKDHIRLQPENPAFEPIRSEFVQILGKVVGLYRKI